MAAALVSFGDARHEISEVLDAHLAQTASLVLAQSGGREDEIDTDHAKVLHQFNRRVMFQVWEDGRILRAHSQNAPDTPLSHVRSGFSDVEIAGARWRVFSEWNPRQRSLVQVAEQMRERDELATAISRNLIVPLAIALPILAVGIWAAVGRATRSLTLVNQQVEVSAAESLTPIDIAHAPLEISGLVANLNALFERVRGLIDRERRFTADAAHELRTPLAAIRAQAQVARGALEPGERTHALDAVIAGCDRAAHVVEQMLTLARLDADSAAFEPATVDLDAVLKTTLADLAPAALAKGMDIGLAQERPVVVSGDAGLLAILFRNVIDNAIRYSPRQTKIDVALDVGERHARVRVTDAGPGIPPEERAKVSQRFYRRVGLEGSGSGLGLSIARRILDLHHGTLEFETASRAGGLQVTIALPRLRDHEPPHDS